LQIYAQQRHAGDWLAPRTSRTVAKTGDQYATNLLRLESAASAAQQEQEHDDFTGMVVGDVSSKAVLAMSKLMYMQPMHQVAQFFTPSRSAYLLT
jgi:DMSO/TMAO reductase YedYZ molybdopterin-dependent catalytic subunit